MESPEEDKTQNKVQFQELDNANLQGDIIRQRQGDINQIETLMTEVHGITQDMAHEVDKADGDLDAINASARSARTNTQKASEEIARGAVYQKQSHKKM